MRRRHERLPLCSLCCARLVTKAACKHSPEETAQTQFRRGASPRPPLLLLCWCYKLTENGCH